MVLDAADADIFWLVFGAVLVFLMQAGFALLEVGSVRPKNTKNILVKNTLDASIGAMIWWLWGFGVAFGADDGSKFMGESTYALSYEYGRKGELSGYLYASWLFQWAFAAAAATIVTGAIAERVTFTAYLTYATVLIGFVYPCVVHSAWNVDGWAAAWREEDLLLDCGLLDFAGSGVVHMTGGIAALVAAIFVGPRKGAFDGDGIKGQSAITRNLGVFILWFGWYGFNGVSTLYIANYGLVAAKTMVTTTIAAGAGCLTTVMLGKYFEGGIISMDHAGNGVLAGLVSITANCSVVEPYGAFIIGFFGGIIYYLSSKLLKMLKIDDVVDAAPVHGFCGMWGVIASGFFATDYNYANAYYSARAADCAGVFYGGDGSTLGVAVIFVLFLLAWVGGIMTFVFAGLKFFGLARVSEEVEEMGLDEHHHGGADAPAGVSGKTVEVANPTA